MKTFFIIVTLLGALLPVLVPFDNRQLGRRFFWAGFVIATVSAFFIAYPPDWKSGIWLALLPFTLMLINAYFSTSHIKIRGKIYAFNVSDSLPDSSSGKSSLPRRGESDYDPAPDSYSGMATAKKSWWLMVFVMILCTFNVVVRSDDKPWLAPLMAAAGVTIAILFGYMDASWGYHVARRQRIQFVITSVITAGVFTVLYFAAYRAGKRWPLRRKQSMEYRAHPRHQKRYP